MLLNNAQKRLTEKGIEDYYFIKSEIDEKIKLNYDADKLKQFLNRFKGIEIYQDEDDYIDFYYNDLNLTLIHNETDYRLCNSISLFDKTTDQYLFECNTIEYLKDQLEKDVFTQLSEEIVRYKDMKESTFVYNLDSKKKEIIKFIEDNL